MACGRLLQPQGGAAQLSAGCVALGMLEVTVKATTLETVRFGQLSHRLGFLGTVLCRWYHKHLQL